MATWSTFARNGRLWSAWLCWIVALLLLIPSVFNAPPKVWLFLFLFFIALSAFQWGEHLKRLRRLGRLHRWPSSDLTLMTAAFGWMVGVLCVLPAAAVGGFGAPGAAIAVGAWGIVGLSVALAQAPASIRRYFSVVLFLFLVFPSRWPSVLVLTAAESSPGAWFFWLGLGALGWLGAFVGFPADDWLLGRIKGAAQARQRSLPMTAVHMADGSAQRRRRFGSLGRAWRWQAGLHPVRFVRMLIFVVCVSAWLLYQGLADFSSVVFLAPILLPSFMAMESWEPRMPGLGEESLRPTGRRSLARELTSALGLEVALYWAGTVLVCCGVVFFTQQNGTPLELWPFLLGSLTLQPLLLAAVTVGFLSLRQDQILEKALAISGFTLVVLLAGIFSEVTYAWMLSISPGSSVWSPWASALVLALGAFGVRASVRRFENLELGRYAVRPA